MNPDRKIRKYRVEKHDETDFPYLMKDESSADFAVKQLLERKFRENAETNKSQ